MASKRSKSKRCIQVIEGGEVITAAEQLWAQLRASFSRAQDATRWMQVSAQIPHPTTRLIN